MGLAEDEDLLDGEALDGLGRPVHEGGHGQQKAGTGILELIGQLPRRVEGIERGVDRAQGGDGVEGDRILGKVRAENGEDVALLDAVPSQSCGDATDAVGELTVGELAAADAVDQGRLAPERVGPLQHELG